IALRQVGVHVVLAIELRVRGDLAVEREARDHRELDRALVRHREGARQTETDRADERIRRRAEPLRRAAAEHLRLGRELDVRLDPDDELVRTVGHGCDGAGTFPSARIRRLRFTITRSSLTETRYWSRSRPVPVGVVGEKLPLGENRNVPRTGPQFATNPRSPAGPGAVSISTEHSASPTRGAQRVGNAK